MSRTDRDASTRSAELRSRALLRGAGCGAPALGSATTPGARRETAPRDGADRRRFPPAIRIRRWRRCTTNSQRSRDRLVLPGQEKPYYIQYRLLDLDERTVGAQFGALLASSTTRNRFMSVDVRVGNYKLDSSNFLSAQGFRGFLGSTGTVGIDRDYDSLRQDLWLATDQAYKEALDSLSHKQRLPAQPGQRADHRRFFAGAADGAGRAARRAGLDFAQLGSGSQDRFGRAAQISRALQFARHLSSDLRDDLPGEHRRHADPHQPHAGRHRGQPGRASRRRHAGAQLSGRSTRIARPSCRRRKRCGSSSTAQGTELVALRAAPPVQDYDGPVLFEAPRSGFAAGATARAVAGRGAAAAVDEFAVRADDAGARRPERMEGRIGQRVLPRTSSLVDDPTVQEFQGQQLIGSYERGPRGRARTEGGAGGKRHAAQLLMSRRPGPDFDESNGHGRSTFLADPRPMMSNLFFTASDGQSPADLRKKFLDACKQNGQSSA